METLPIGVSCEYTTSGDVSGGGLSKSNNNFEIDNKEDIIQYRNNLWDDE